MHHIYRVDHRIGIVKKLIEPFQLQLNEIIEFIKVEGDEYWDMVFADEFEHYVGTVFIILQNYINSSISDLYPDLIKLHSKYSIEPMIENTNTSKIQLIISIANYYKHRDLPSDLHTFTSKVFDILSIDYKRFYVSKNVEYFHERGSNSPVFTGLTILSDSWNFDDVLKEISIWREKMWQIYGQ